MFKKKAIFSIPGWLDRSDSNNWNTISIHPILVITFVTNLFQRDKNLPRPLSQVRLFYFEKYKLRVSFLRSELTIEDIFINIFPRENSMCRWTGGWADCENIEIIEWRKDRQENWAECVHTLRAKIHMLSPEDITRPPVRVAAVYRSRYGLDRRPHHQYHLRPEHRLQSSEDFPTVNR